MNEERPEPKKSNIRPDLHISFQAYMPVDCRNCSDHADVASIFTAWRGQFDYAETRRFSSTGSEDCYVPLNEFEAFIKPEHLTEELRSFVAKAHEAGAGSVGVFWNCED
ncbi:hypothetical protein [Dechloromonas hortensis]|uniref:hypothetical protein n=1 Tax=Dechloromonas hortensis TaxID=337779 RepID=UPI0012914B8E|nr:hypothetical protein [Dechloromonas hortensis]